MASLWLEHTRVRWGRWSAISVVAAIVAMGLVFGPHRRAAHHLIEEAAREGWQLQAADQERGLFTTVLREVRLSWRQAPGILVEAGRVEIRHWPWLRPRVKIADPRGDFRGDVTTVLQALTTLAMWGSAHAVEVPAAEATYHHPLIGALAMDGVRLVSLTRGSAAVLVADQVRMGDRPVERAWRSVRFAVERHKDMFIIGWGDTVVESRVQLSCFPSSQGQARWLLDVLHQGVRPLAARIGWQLGPEFEATRIAGSLSLDIPDRLSDQAGEPVRGRVQLVLDQWPGRGESSPSALVGSTLSLVSNLVPAANGTGWDLPRVALSTPVFDLSGPGQVDLASAPRFHLEATGARTCRQLRALLPPSVERERVDAYLAGRDGKTAGKAQLHLVWRASEPPAWRLDGGCGLDSASL
jgi:hypothetical protein